MEIHGESMEIDGNHDNPLKSIRNRWKSMEIIGNPKKSIGNLWKTMGISGNPWKSWDFFWKSIEIYRNPLEIHGKSFGLLLPVKSLSILLRNLNPHRSVFKKYPS